LTSLIGVKRGIDHVDQLDEIELHKTKGKRIDYRYINDPFPDEKEAAKITLATSEIPEPIRPAIYTSETDNECRSLHDVKASLEWLEWQDAINVELNQL